MLTFNSMNIDGKRILILGGAGFVGANLIRHLLLVPGIKITVVDSLDPRFKSNRKHLDSVIDQINFVVGDILDDVLLNRVIPDQDIIFNLAGQTSHPYSLENPVLDAQINCIGVLKVLMAIKQFNPQARVVFSSSSTLTGRSLMDIIDEDHPENPLDIYSAHKGVAEKYHKIFHNVYGLNTVCLRFANIFGPFGKADPSFGFLNYFIDTARQGKSITVYGDGEQTRNVMFVDDVCDILLLAGNHPKLAGQVLFATHHDHYSVKEIAEAIAQVFDSGVEFVPWPAMRKKIDVDKVRFSSKRLYDLTGWQAKHSLLEGLKITKRIIDDFDEEK